MNSPASAPCDLRLGLEAVRRFDDSTNGVNGQVIGLWGFSLPGQSVKQNWARVTADVDHRFSNTLALTFGANAASTRGDANWGGDGGVAGEFLIRHLSFPEPSSPRQAGFFTLGKR